MRRILILSTVLTLAVGCRTTDDTALLRETHYPLGKLVYAPFDEAVENARQPDPIIGRVFFEYDKADLSPEAKEELALAAKEASRRKGLVIVEGYADHMNTDEFNKRLGYERALTAADYLRSEGVWDERLVVHGFGEARPTTTNWKDLGRALNRSVVVRMYAQGKGASGAEALKSYKATLQSCEASGASNAAAEDAMALGSQ